MASENPPLTGSEVESSPFEGAADNEILGENTEVAGEASNSNEKAADEKVKGLEKKEKKKRGRGNKQQIKDEVGETTKQDNVDEPGNEPVQLARSPASELTDDYESENTDDSRKAKKNAKPDRQPANFKDISMGVVILLALAVVCLVSAILVGPVEPEMKTDLDFPKIFENKLGSLQSLFTNQSDRFWRILKNRGLAHLRNTNPRQPLVLLLAAPPPAHDVVDCLATKLAEMLDPKHKRNLAMVDGTVERSEQGTEVKKKMDDLLIEKFKQGHRAALIYHLEHLPPPSPLLFYSYCDDQNAPHKHVAIIFTVHLPREPDSSLPANEAEGTVEKYLSNEVWTKEDQDSIAALLSRVADTVALMNGESSESVKTLCSWRLQTRKKNWYGD